MSELADELLHDHGGPLMREAASAVDADADAMPISPDDRPERATPGHAAPGRGPMPTQLLRDWRTIDPATIRAQRFLVEETLLYREKIEDLVQRGEGRYVLIVGCDVIDFFDDLRSAAEYAMKHFDRASVLIKRVALLEPVPTFGGIVGVPGSIDRPPTA